MKKAAVAMLTLTLFARLLAAQTYDLKPLLGKSWYGLYFGGQKAGYAMSELIVGPDGTAVFVNEASFRIVMASIKQDMNVTSKRTYAPSGELRSIESSVKDPSGLTTRLHATVGDGVLLLRSEVGGVVSEKKLADPKETIADALKELELMKPGAKIGDRVEYSTFEPEYQMSVACKSEIRAIEERVLDGVRTKVFSVETDLTTLGIQTTSYATEDGKLLESVTAGILTMRVEPEAMAKDVNYVNDVVVSNAAMLDKPIEDPRNRDSLSLRLSGPLGPGHIFNDDRQKTAMDGPNAIVDLYRIDPASIAPRTLPVVDESVVEWTKPSMYIQSDAPKMVAKAKEIVGAETDAIKASNLLCEWVYDNVRSTFSARLTNAMEVLDQLEGDCTEHSVLFIGLARAIGLPAREVAGLVYVEGPKPGFFFHQWAKVWVGKWIDVDPTFDQPLADVTHVKLVEGELASQAKILPLIGKLKVDVISKPVTAPDPK